MNPIVWGISLNVGVLSFNVMLIGHNVGAISLNVKLTGFNVAVLCLNDGVIRIILMLLWVRLT